MASITTIQTTDLITDSRADLNNNFTNLNSDKIETSVLDTDTTLAADSDAKVATQKATKAYVDAGGNVNATDQNKGIVEIATQAEVDAGTDTGGSGASLSVVPSQISGLKRIRKIVIDPSFTEIADNTTTKTDILSETISGGSLSTNNGIRFKVYVSNFSVDSNASSDPVFRLKYGATTIATTTLTESGGQQLTGFIEGLLMADTSTSAQSGSFYTFFKEPRLDLSAGDSSIVYAHTMTTGTSAEDSSGDLTLSLTIQWGSAQASSDFVPAGIVVELIT